MPDAELTALTAYTTPTSVDLIYVVKTSDSTDKKVTIGNLFLNVPSNGLKVGTDQLVVSGGFLGIGKAVPIYYLDVYQNDTYAAPAVRHLISAELDINPPATVNSFWRGCYIDIQQTNPAGVQINGVTGLYINIDNIRGTGAIGGLYVAINLPYNTGVTKALEFVGINQAVNASLYACQMTASNKSFFGSRGTSSLLVGSRIKVENFSHSTASGNSDVTEIRGIHMTANNEGGAPFSANTTRLYGLAYDFTNKPDATIGTSYGIHLSTPSNTGAVGAVTNHYGIYLEDQTLAGTTLNYALYIAGGLSKFGGAIEIAEQAAPAGLTDTVRIFAQDNGAGKTQLMVQFGSGIAQQIAIEA